GRLARGTLVGNEGGRIPGDGSVVVEIPAGATSEPLRASSSSLTPEDLTAFGSVAGFRILGGFALELERASDAPQPDLDGDGVPDAIPVELHASARVTFNVDPAQLPAGAEVIVAEVLDGTSNGRVVRLASRATEVALDGSESKLFTTRPIDRAVLPLDGVVREGRYLFLAAEQPIAFATGAVRRGASAPYLAGALITAPPLGVQDVTRITGLFAIPVPAVPATPFTLTARHPATGEGTPYLSATAPDASSIVAIGDFILVPQPPRVTSTTPAQNAIEVPLTTTVRVQFDRALDPSSIAPATIVVTNATNGSRIEGTTSLDGASAVLWTPPSIQRPLSPATRYEASVAASLRATTGAPLGAPYAFGFTTVTTLTSTQVHPERIRITIPQNGISTIRGTAGALPSGWQAVAVRRSNDFIVRYQATAAADGSFSFLAGDATADRITITDAIDLQVLNTSGTLTAIIPLTPFISEDGRSFVASPNTSSTITTPDGITVTVPAGAFDQPTLVTAAPMLKESIADVPQLDEELNWSAAVEVTFDCTVGGAAPSAPCRAKQRLDLEIPAAAADPTRVHILALRAPSILGPRLMAVDTLRVVDSRFTTLLSDGTSAQGGGASFQSVTASSTTPPLAPRPSSLAPSQFEAPTLQASQTDDKSLKLLLLGVTYPGIYSAVDIKVPAGSSVGWAVMDGLQYGYDLFWDTLDTFFAANVYLAESRGRIAIPVLTNLPFTVTGVDAATGLDAFEKIYEPIPVGDPGVAVTVPAPLSDVHGPYPIFATPFRIETLDLTVENVAIESIRNFVMHLKNGNVTVTDSSNSLDSSIPVTLINAGNGKVDALRGDGLGVLATIGDRIILVIGSVDVDPDTALSIVFSEPISLGGAEQPSEVDAFLRTILKIQKIAGTSFEDVTAMFRFSVDSGDRRIRIDRRGALERGAKYRLLISKDLADPSGLKIGEIKVGDQVQGGLSSDLRMELTTRAPGGNIGSFDLTTGAIRDVARTGNMLFVTALDGGLQAFDVADPAAAKPLRSVPRVVDDSWAIAIDRHDRIFTTTLGNLFGGMRSYRVEDFRGALTEEPPSVGAAIVSWVPGYQGSLGLASANAVSDRPEAIPRKLQVLAQDVELPCTLSTIAECGLTATKTADHTDGFQEVEITVSFDPALQYAAQRITLENTTAGFRWSGDATQGSPAKLTRVLARPSDQLVLVRNQRTYGVISLFGHGIGVFDLNAIESNDAAVKPEEYETIRESILVTSAKLDSNFCGHPDLTSGAIPDLTFSPEAAIGF
ncbi:MAG: Ig-like domain-containing protein, partial [Acidobacteria bacterium]|nr:Ig-like domain-containing protein [Acidobacteriota bacterium]